MYVLMISFILISLRLCADPRRLNFLLLKILGVGFLLNDGIYTPSKLSLIASFRSLAKNNFLFVNLQIFLSLSISSILYFLL